MLRDDPIEELNRFVQNSSDQMLHRLAFAVGEKDGRTVVVLRMRPSRLPPPELVLKAEAYKSYLKLPNLFVPAGKALHPPLRRDMVRRLLADDPAQVVWLAPVDGGPLAPRAASDSRSESPTMGFRPETLPEDAFRPLIDWIDYVLDHEKAPLQAWVQAAQFDFEAFICDEDFAAKPKKPPAPPEPKRARKRAATTGLRRRPSRWSNMWTNRGAGGRKRKKRFSPSKKWRRASCSGGGRSWRGASRRWRAGWTRRSGRRSGRSWRR